MTLTITSDSGKRAGPGIPLTFHWDLIGPIPSFTSLHVAIETTDGVHTIGGSQVPVSSNDIPMVLLNAVTGGSTVSPNWSVSPGASVQLHAFIFEAGTGSTVDETFFTGWTWEPVTNIWFFEINRLLFYISQFATNPGDIAAIKAAVIHSYTN